MVVTGFREALLGVSWRALPVGFINILLFLGLFATGNRWLSPIVPIGVILVATYVFSTSFAFLKNRLIVYPAHRSKRLAYWRFSLIYYGMIPINLLFLDILEQYGNVEPVLGQLFWVPFGVTLRLVVVRVWVFDR